VFEDQLEPDILEHLSMYISSTLRLVVHVTYLYLLCQFTALQWDWNVASTLTNITWPTDYHELTSPTEVKLDVSDTKRTFNPNTGGIATMACLYCT